MSSRKIYIGTSGWMYKSWAKSFYPVEWPARRKLEFYSSKLPTVEINATFYRLPQEKTFEGQLARFLKQLPRRFHQAVEFTHRSWLDEEVREILKRHGVANVSVSSQTMPMHFDTTANFVYLRFHGLTGGSAHDYTDRELEPWAEHLCRSVRRGSIGFVYFNNDVNTQAPLNALRLMDMVGKYAVRPPEC